MVQPTLLVAMALSLTGCGGGAGVPADAAPPATGPPGVLFVEDFERAVGPPFITGYPALPVALFPDDGSRWTQIQDSHLGKNDAGIAAARGGHALFLLARGEAPDIASKMDLGKGSGLGFGVGEIVRIRASFFVDADSGPFVSNTLIDIEDGDDLRINGGFVTAGLRIRTNDVGALALDRGELVGSDAAESPHFRLGGFHSDLVVPSREWFTVEAVIKLGVNVPRSTIRPIDHSFGAATTAAWCEIYYQAAGGARTLVLRMRGTTYLDREAGVALLRAAGVTFDWPADYDYDSFQFGLTNNRSTVDQRLLVDDIVIERVAP